MPSLCFDMEEALFLLKNKAKNYVPRLGIVSSTVTKLLYPKIIYIYIYTKLRTIKSICAK